LEQEKTLSIEHFRTNIDIARAQAEVMGEAFKSANIKIVGGDEAFFNRFTNAVSMGQSIDGFLSTSKVAQRALSRVLGDDDHGPNGKNGAAAKPAASGGLDISSVLTDLLSKVDAESADKVQSVLRMLQVAQAKPTVEPEIVDEP
ncbi:MAG: hypothetical protein ACNA8W_20460, partial [Bradymonadaceae bacterium]